MQLVTDCRKAIQMNLPVLLPTARLWVDIFDFSGVGSPRTPPLPSLLHEVRVLAGMVST